jgi:hypothetical protein
MSALLLALLLLRLPQEAPAPPQPAPAPSPDGAVNEQAVIGLLTRVVEAQAAWGRENAGKRASLLDLILAQKVPADLRDGIAAGYRFKLTLGETLRTFELTATPLEYGRTGTRSFFADKKGVRGEDARGEVASGKAPLLLPAEK